MTSVEGQVESWASPITSAVGTTFDHTFTNVGDFAYYCTVHGADLGNGTAAGMSGVVHVSAVPEPGSLVLLGVGVAASAFILGRRRLRTRTRA